VTLLRRCPEWFAELGRDAIYDMDLAMQIAADLLIRDALQRLQEYVQWDPEGFLGPWTRDRQLPVADRQRS
jgi:hypothetical protein